MAQVANKILRVWSKNVGNNALVYRFGPFDDDEVKTFIDNLDRTKVYYEREYLYQEPLLWMKKPEPEPVIPPEHIFTEEEIFGGKSNQLYSDEVLDQLYKGLNFAEKVLKALREAIDDEAADDD